MYNTLMKKIKSKTAVLGVIGLGYVGLPLAVEKANSGYKVLGFDIQQKRVDFVNSGHNYIGDVIDSNLFDIVKNKKLSATTDFSMLSQCDCVAVCVPTPLDHYFQPDISYVKNSTEEIIKYAHKGMLVVLESTTYPGTTEEVIGTRLTESGFSIGEDMFLAFSPERVDPGNAVYKTKNTPKVVGGVTEKCTSLAKELYGSVLESEIYVTSSPKVAEMEKIFENTFRNINIALSNEMAILCKKMDIPVWEVIDAAKSKPYGFMAFYPGPGLGGHCIPIDPFYLTWKAREYNYHTRLIEIAGEINNSMPDYVISRVADQLNTQKKSINGSNVFVLGLAYKPDIDDIRESPSIKLIELLKDKGAVVSYNDPYTESFRELLSVEITQKSLADADIVIIATNHSAYDPKYIVKHSRLVFDSRNLTKDIESENLEKL